MKSPGYEIGVVIMRSNSKLLPEKLLHTKSKLWDSLNYMKVIYCHIKSKLTIILTVMKLSQLSLS